MKKAEKEAVVALFNSDVKNSSYSSEPEVHLNKRSKDLDFPMKMSLGSKLSLASKTVKVADIGSLTVKQEIELMCKVVKVSGVSLVTRSGDTKELKKNRML